MARHSLFQKAARLAGLFIALQAAGGGPARADVISTSAELPLLGVPYISTVGAGCFPAAGVCVTAGSLTLTAPVTTTFTALGESILSDAVFSGLLTTLGGTSIGPVSLVGTFQQLVNGRTTSNQLGTWATDLVSMALSGPVLGHTLTLTRDSIHPSTGTSSVQLAVDQPEGSFRISSFFDVFVDLSLDGPNPLTASRGPIHFEAAVPEPVSLLIVGPAGLALLAARRRRGGRNEVPR